MLKIYITLLLTLCFAHSQAEIWTWTDENGVKHYGQEVPEKYREQANSLETNQHKPSDKDVAEAEQRVRSWQQQNAEFTRDQKIKDQAAKKAKQEKAKQQAQKKKQNASEYEKSVACFAKCRRRVASGALDNSKCGHCKAVPKPD